MHLHQVSLAGLVLELISSASVISDGAPTGSDVAYS